MGGAVNLWWALLQTPYAPPPLPVQSGHVCAHPLDREAAHHLISGGDVDGPLECTVHCYRHDLRIVPLDQLSI